MQWNRSRFQFSFLNENNSSNGTLGGQSNDEKVRTLGWKSLLEILSIRSLIWTLANQGVLGTRVPKIDFLESWRKGSEAMLLVRVPQMKTGKEERWQR